jgi:hypothetical protein
MRRPGEVLSTRCSYYVQHIAPKMKNDKRDSVCSVCLSVKKKRESKKATQSYKITSSSRSSKTYFTGRWGRRCEDENIKMDIKEAEHFLTGLRQKTRYERKLIVCVNINNRRFYSHELCLFLFSSSSSSSSFFLFSYFLIFLFLLKNSDTKYSQTSFFFFFSFLSLTLPWLPCVPQRPLNSRNNRLCHSPYNCHQRS